ncbi:2-succinyl-5-enolpyruvyl-6-hydroxy-3-cyclohexene-1-carboxylic-acid synthase [Geobacillus thermodenitrificans]|uniref:2-succinyl-5-enolpyruvyl-6-hydroxy-3-cyclohexene-1-carboxylate synthase n=2 Tax=Geobacillus thermodenitrificans TaxID=33940 RepID=MEND_GEOTN|nr:2-succinyl-5-enolpyruvyl-6-hydroxy-3-cyclohexene-1-carboxylic-acid synthase [Geobacillus thermodenitrificans]A4IS14.1 RecName: Full=2-succinyl-5-enolpyruvyl-6-hydroxy-3-cyclohexene-1-carboxylate synthase; Short=SEPHCHC synthase; AltName: Full=Menaquinone biosynthesis protein MenD [Geobacillus thermodenitrificans NG80-2]ABO68118.1 2-succinyl-6-hydroxy-2,4-cyclohexadiene-1-carboxylicacid synthase/2-oxoglutarate decarboxylase [Geobacillus thermodenitrificans NG80-2]MEC5186994.1 2-succinyl-5-enol
MTNALSWYVAAFVDGLVQAGVTEAVISPGSRSTPLAMAMAAHSGLHFSMHIDERSAAFFALGMVKAKQRPVALVCTSGTAAANYLPAIVEAYYSRVPLVVLTADRPHELRDVGAPQAIDQLHLYGRYAKWFVDLALPEETDPMLSYARTMAARAAAIAAGAPAGPVHVNVPLREPLVPTIDEAVWEKVRTVAETPQIMSGRATLPAENVAALYEQLAAAKRGLIVCGALDQPGFAEAVTELARTLDFPILADPLSQLRAGAHDKTYVIDSYDAILKDEAVASRLVPDVVLRFGAMPVSKPLFLWLKQHRSIRQIVVDDGGWRDPTLEAACFVRSDETVLCRQLLDIARPKQKESAWSTTWREMNDIARTVLRQHLPADEWFEGKVFTELAELLPAGATLFVGNSMPIRDADTFLFATDKPLRVLANRGANGIDGVVSSALGASLAASPLVLVIGDLSFYHDLNGLLAAKMHGLQATIVLMNNNGGGIFSFLPQARHEGPFETLFGTPTDLTFAHAVEMYGGRYAVPHTWGEFRHHVAESLNTGGLSVIEVRTSRTENVQMHRFLWERVSQEIAKFLEQKGTEEPWN